MKLGFFEAGLPNCAHDAGSTACVELCTLARSLGHDVTYAYTGDNPWGREDDLRHAAIPFTVTPPDRARFLKEHGFDAVILSRPGPAAQWLRTCETLGVPVIYFGHDIHYERMTRGNALLPPPQRTPARDIAAIRTLEHHLWQRVKAVIYPSREEAEAVNAFCGGARGIAMPIYDIDEAVKTFEAAPAAAPVPGALFVGGALHQPNQDAIRWFAREVSPLLKHPCPLRVVGDWPQELVQAYPSVTFLGRLSAQDLYKAYRSAPLVIAPLRFGAGVKRKVVEAIAFGKTVLSTPIGFEGLGLPSSLSHLCVPADARSFAAALDALPNEKLSESLRNYAANLRTEYGNKNRRESLENALSMV